MAFEILARLGLNATGFQSGLKRAESAGTRFSSSLRNQIAAAFTVGAIVQFTRKTIEAAGEIKDTSDKLGISTKRVQELSFAAKQTGSDLGTVSGAYAQLAKSIAAAQKDSGGADANALAAFGVSSEDLRNLNLDQVFDKIAARMKGVSSGAREMTLAMEVFGKSGTSLIPMLIAGFDDLAKAAPIMADPTVKALDDLGDKLDEIKTKATVEFAPVIVSVFDTLAAAIIKVKDALDDAARFWAVFWKEIRKGGDTNPALEKAAGAMAQQQNDRDWKRIRDNINRIELDLVQKGIKLPGADLDAAAKGERSAPSPRQFQQDINALQRIGAEIIGAEGNVWERRQLDVQMKMERHLNDIRNRGDTAFP